MKYLLLIYNDEAIWNKLSPSENAAVLGQFQAFGKEFAAKILGGNALQSTQTARSVRVQNGKTLVTDGPFAETKEQLGGYYLIEAANQAEAEAIAARIPCAPLGTVEVRPIQTFS